LYHPLCTDNNSEGNDNKLSKPTIQKLKKSIKIYYNSNGDNPKTYSEFGSMELAWLYVKDILLHKYIPQQRKGAL
jgi:hypothetical protein